MIFFIALIATSFVYLSFLGTKDLRLERDTKRKEDVQKILTALTTSLQNNKENVEVIPMGKCGESKAFEICRTGARSCKGLVNVSFLTVKAEYLTGIPTDPVGINENGSGYAVTRDEKGMITVCAPVAERNPISVSTLKNP